MTDLQHLIDEREIRRCILLHARSFDRGDGQTIRTVTLAETGDLGGGTIDDVAPRPTGAVPPLIAHHVVGNMLVDVRGSVALAESYFTRYLEVDGGDEVVGHLVGGRHVDHLERPARQWVVTNRSTVVDWSHALPALTSPVGVGYHGPVGGPDDLADVAFRELQANSEERYDAGETDSTMKSSSGSAAGAGAVVPETGIDLLLAERAIVRRIHEYAHGSDRNDLDLLRSCYTDQAYDDHGPVGGNIDDFVAFLRNKTSSHGAKTHLIGNVLVEVQGARAVAESYFLAYLEERAADGRLTPHLLGGRYVDRFELTNGDWRIAHRTVVMDWSRQLAEAPSWPYAADLPVGTRDERDPASAAFREFRADRG